jgi:hypothetical protein
MPTCSGVPSASTSSERVTSTTEPAESPRSAASAAVACRAPTVVAARM